jgi:hypothetical protein
MKLSWSCILGSLEVRPNMKPPRNPEIGWIPMAQRHRNSQSHRIGWWENFNRKALYLMVKTMVSG